MDQPTKPVPRLAPLAPTAELKEAFAVYEKSLGFIPNSVLIMQRRPKMVRALAQLAAPLDFRLGFGRFGDAQVVHLCDAASQVAAHADLAASTAGDLAATFAALADAGAPSTDRNDWVARLRDDEHGEARRGSAGLAADDGPIKPTRIYGELRKRLDRDAIVIGDGGDFVSYAGKYVDSYVPGTFLDPGPYGCLGMGPGYALAAGARASRPAGRAAARRRCDRLRAGRLRDARAARGERGGGRRQQRDLGTGEAPDAGAVRVRRGRRAQPRHPVRPGGRPPSAAPASS